MKANVTPLRLDGLDGLRPSWDRLASQAPRSPYETFTWLRAWTDVYVPASLALAEVERSDGTIAGLGLIEVCANGHWRFAGAPVSSTRGLLCAPGSESAVWRAFEGWLRRNRKEWTTLGTVTAPLLGGRIALAHAVEVVVPSMDLPASFDEYLAERSSRTRKGMRQRMRKLERAHGEIVPVAADDREAALRDMVRMHGERARYKGEIHDDVDARLARLLDVVAAAPDGPAVRVTELVVASERAGVNVRIDHDGTAYSYSDGVSVNHLDMSPGIAFELDSIRDAIERGIRRYDLGPGEYDYKRKLGAATVTRQIEAELASPSARGALRRTKLTIAGRLRSTRWAAGSIRWLRGQFLERQSVLPFPLLEQFAYWSPVIPYGRTPVG